MQEIGSDKMLSGNKIGGISFAVVYLSRIMKSPEMVQFSSTKHELRYLEGMEGLVTVNLGDNYVQDDFIDYHLVGYKDSDWALRKQQWRLISRYMYVMAGGAIR